MKIFKKLTIFIVFINSVYAFDYSSCISDAKKKSNLFPHFISTTSYISSTGKCAMIGIVEHDKKVFLAHNYEEVKKDIARGSGEYLDSFLRVGKCFNIKIVKKELKRNYDSIYRSRASFKQVNEALEKFLVKFSCDSKDLT